MSAISVTARRAKTRTVAFVCVLLAAIPSSLVAVAIVQACSEPPQARADQPRIERDYASLYGEDTLAYWENRYKPALEYNLVHLIVDSLTPPQRKKMRGWKLLFPRRDRNDPIAFYADPPTATITISALSMKFFDDFATATVWLEHNGFSIETTAYYADVLKYRGPERFPGGRYLSPLQALGIPSDALKDSVVNDVALKILNTAMVFTMAHEVGHIVNGHRRDVSAEQRQVQETEADSFAIDAFKRIGLAPGGMVTLFFMTTWLGDHRGDFDSDQAWNSWLSTHVDHPLSSRRLKAIANMLNASPELFARNDGNRSGPVERVRFMASQIDGISAILDDTVLSKQAKLVGEQIPLAELHPRRVGNPWYPKR